VTKPTRRYIADKTHRFCSFLIKHFCIELGVKKQTQSGTEPQNRETMSSLTPPFHALIAAAGSGTRLGGERPKQYQTIAGKTLLRLTLEAFLACETCVSIRVIIDPDHADWYQKSIIGLENEPILANSVFGSKTRKLSVYNGLQALSHIKPEDIVLIHDAARIFITPESIKNASRETSQSGAVTLAAPIADTLQTLDGERIDRESVRALQTPQGFRYDLILRAHETFKDSEATDDAGLVQQLGHKVTLIDGPKSNIKITTQEDMMLAKAIMEPQSLHWETRTGLGYDVHAFASPEESQGTVRLCGIDIEHERSLAGHSDADVGLHTITDAIYGALALGDIGTHFPPSNDDFKNMDSAVFLEHAVNASREAGAQINHIDLTLICEAPKIGPHREAMIARIADITGLEPHRISIKATTTERLGFTGRGEGIAAQAVATLKTPAT